MFRSISLSPSGGEGQGERERAAPLHTLTPTLSPEGRGSGAGAGSVALTSPPYLSIRASSPRPARVAGPPSSPGWRLTFPSLVGRVNTNARAPALVAGPTRQESESWHSRPPSFTSI